MLRRTLCSEKEGSPEDFKPYEMMRTGFWPNLEIENLVADPNILGENKLIGSDSSAT